MIALLVLFVMLIPVPLVASGTKTTTAQHDVREFPIYFVYIDRDVFDKLDNNELSSDLGATYSNIERALVAAENDGFVGLGFYWIWSDMLCRLYGITPEEWIDTERAYVTITGCFVDDIEKLLANAESLKIAVQRNAPTGILTLDAAKAAELAEKDADEARAAAAEARASAATAEADAVAARSATEELRAIVNELESRIVEFEGGVPLFGTEPGMLNIDYARFTAAGPNSIYISGIKYAGNSISARVRYSDGIGTAEQIFETQNSLVDILDLDAAEVEVVDGSLKVENVGVGGQAHTLTLQLNHEGRVDISAENDGWPVRTVNELHRDKLIRSGKFLLNGFTGGHALHGEGSWRDSDGSLIQADRDASDAKFEFEIPQNGSDVLFGVNASDSARGGSNVGFGIHFLASGTSDFASVAGYGRSYLLWVLQDRTNGIDTTYLELYESFDSNKMIRLVSWRIFHTITEPLLVEALYQANGNITLFVEGEEQLTINVGSAIVSGDRIALRARSGPIDFVQVYVATE